MTTTFLKRVLALLAGTVTAGLSSTAPAAAQTFPTKPIRFVVGIAPGGSADVMARLVGQTLSETIGHAVITENRPDAVGTLGAGSVGFPIP